MPAEADLKLYNTIVRDSVVQIARGRTGDDVIGPLLKTDAGEVELRVDSAAIPDFTFEEKIVPADFVKVRQGLRAQSVVSGVGAPLIVRRPRSEADPMIPESGLWVPVTALLHLDQPGNPVLELVDPTRRKSVTYGGRSFPLSANYTAAFARDFQARQLQFENLTGLFRFEQFADRMGISRATPLDPAKEVCVFIHGINSSPSTWDEVLNRLYGDEAIRDRYEFWLFGYPTGAPIPYMAAEFRAAIHRMLEFRRSQGAGPQRVTVVGHSMGGLLAKSLTFSGGDADWNRLFKVPVDELNIRENEREELRRMIYFEPVPEVRRVVFCAVPHRGSRLVEQPAAKLLGDVVQVPAQLLVLSAQIIAQSANALTPEGFEFARDRLTSIDQLRAETWVTAEFLNKPLNPAVSYHSLIGNFSVADRPAEKSNDGVVPYSSSHLEGVASEHIVRPAGHSVHRTGAGIEEIRRILKLP